MFTSVVWGTISFVVNIFLTWETCRSIGHYPNNTCMASSSPEVNLNVVHFPRFLRIFVLSSCELGAQGHGVQRTTTQI